MVVAGEFVGEAGGWGHIFYLHLTLTCNELSTPWPRRCTRRCTSRTVAPAPASRNKNMSTVKNRDCEAIKPQKRCDESGLRGRNGSPAVRERVSF